MIQQVTPENLWGNASSENIAAPGAAASPENAVIDPESQTIIEVWASPDQATKNRIMSLTKSLGL